MIYHGYLIEKHPRGFTVQPPRGGRWAEIAPTKKIATKWIEADQARKRYDAMSNARRLTLTNSDR